MLSFSSISSGFTSQATDCRTDDCRLNMSVCEDTCHMQGIGLKVGTQGILAYRKQSRPFNTPQQTPQKTGLHSAHRQAQSRRAVQRGLGRSRTCSLRGDHVAESREFRDSAVVLETSAPARAKTLRRRNTSAAILQDSREAASSFRDQRQDLTEFAGTACGAASGASSSISTATMSGSSRTENGAGRKRRSLQRRLSLSAATESRNAGGKSEERSIARLERLIDRSSFVCASQGGFSPRSLPRTPEETAFSPWDWCAPVAELAERLSDAERENMPLQDDRPVASHHSVRHDTHMDAPTTRSTMPHFENPAVPSAAQYDPVAPRAERSGRVPLRRRRARVFDSEDEASDAERDGEYTDDGGNQDNERDNDRDEDEDSRSCSQQETTGTSNLSNCTSSTLRNAAQLRQVQLINPEDIDMSGCAILGHGAGGVVTKAVHTPTGTPLAVKMMKVGDHEHSQLVNDLNIFIDMADAQSPFLVGPHFYFFRLVFLRTHCFRGRGPG